MNKEEILEYNKRCAEFLDYELITPNKRRHPDKNSIPNNSVEVNLQLWKEHRPKIIYYE